jgi:hypothetical protein
VTRKSTSKAEAAANIEMCHLAAKRLRAEIEGLRVTIEELRARISDLEKPAGEEEE